MPDAATMVYSVRSLPPTPRGEPVQNDDNDDTVVSATTTTTTTTITGCEPNVDSIANGDDETMKPSMQLGQAFVAAWLGFTSAMVAPSTRSASRRQHTSSRHTNRRQTRRHARAAVIWNTIVTAQFAPLAASDAAAPFHGDVEHLRTTAHRLKVALEAYHAAVPATRAAAFGAAIDVTTVAAPLVAAIGAACRSGGLVRRFETALGAWLVALLDHAVDASPSPCPVAACACAQCRLVVAAIDLGCALYTAHRVATHISKRRGGDLT